MYKFHQKCWLIGGLVHFIFKNCIMVPTLVPILHVKWVPPEWVQQAQQDGPTSGYPPNTHLNVGHLVGHYEPWRNFKESSECNDIFAYFVVYVTCSQFNDMCIIRYTVPNKKKGPLSRSRSHLLQVLSQVFSHLHNSQDFFFPNFHPFPGSFHQRKPIVEKWTHPSLEIYIHVYW